MVNTLLVVTQIKVCPSSRKSVQQKKCQHKY